MKQLFAVLAIAALAACGDQTPPPAAKKAESAPPPAPVATAPAAPLPKNPSRKGLSGWLNVWGRAPGAPPPYCLGGRGLS